MKFAVKNTFLQFEDGVASAGHSCKLRALSADYIPSSSRSDASPATSSSSQFGQRGRQLREQQKVGHGSSPSPGLPSDASTTSETEQPLAAEHVVLESSNSSASSLVFGLGTQRPTGGLELVDMRTSEFNVADNWTGNFVLEDASSAESFVSDDQTCVIGHPSLGSAKHASETCKPCHYFHSKLGCNLDQQCGFCHYSHPKRSKTGVPKVQRNLCQRLVETINQGVPGSKEMAAAEEQLWRWIGQDDSRMGAYAVKACRCFQGQSNDKTGVARFLRAATESRQGFKDAEEASTGGDDKFPKVGSMFCPATEASEGWSVAESALWTRVSL